MSDLSPRVAVYPGSFDPITRGHLNVIHRASRLFDRLIVGIGANVGKGAMFTPDERVALVAVATQDLENVEIRKFSGLAVEFVKQCGARVMLRGVRPITDMPAEITMMMANRRLSPDVETLFLIADGELAPRLQFADQGDRAGHGRRGVGPVSAGEGGAGGAGETAASRGAIAECRVGRAQRAPPFCFFSHRPRLGPRLPVQSWPSREPYGRDL